jgi:hypothetical protein
MMDLPDLVVPPPSSCLGSSSRRKNVGSPRSGKSPTAMINITTRCTTSMSTSVRSLGRRNGKGNKQQPDWLVICLRLMPFRGSDSISPESLQAVGVPSGAPHPPPPHAMRHEPRQDDIVVVPPSDFLGAPGSPFGLAHLHPPTSSLQYTMPSVSPNAYSFQRDTTPIALTHNMISHHANQPHHQPPPHPPPNHTPAPGQGQQQSAEPPHRQPLLAKSQRIESLEYALTGQVSSVSNFFRAIDPVRGIFSCVRRSVLIVDIGPGPRGVRTILSEGEFDVIKRPQNKTKTPR